MIKDSGFCQVLLPYYFLHTLSLDCENIIEHEKRKTHCRPGEIRAGDIVTQPAMGLACLHHIDNQHTNKTKRSYSCEDSAVGIF
jgi:hypothetical protein